MFKKIWKRNNTDEQTQEPKDKRLTNSVPSHEELKRNAHKRLSTINSEFRHTFKFIQRYPHSISFFGSARFAENHPYYIQARSLARRIVEETKYTIVTGGGPGIMEAANRGAYEAGGKSIGMNIILPHEQKINEYLTASIRFYYFFIRKVALSFSAEVYVFFPGGFGTMDEFFELVTLVQTRKIPRVPIICVGKEYWNHVLKLAEAMRDEYKTISAGDEKVFYITDDEAEIVNIIKQTPLRKE